MATFVVYPTTPGGPSQPDLALPVSDISRSGIVRGGLVPSANSTAALAVNVAAGDWFFGGLWATMVGSATVYVAQNPAANPRIDVVVAQINPATSQAQLAVVAGVPGQGAPTLPNTLPSLAIAQVTVPSGATFSTVLGAQNVLDVRAVRASGGAYAEAQAHGPDHASWGSDPLRFRGDLAFGELSRLVASNSGGEYAAVQSIAVGVTATPYQVPAGYNLFVTSIEGASAATATIDIYTAALATHFTIVDCGHQNVSLPVPIVVPPTGGIGRTAGITTALVRGLLVPQTKVTAVIQNLTIASGATYTVPAGQWFVLLSLYSPYGGTSQQSALQIDGQQAGIPAANHVMDGTFRSQWSVGTITALYGGNIIEQSTGLNIPVGFLARPLLYPPGTLFANTKTVSGAAITLNGYTFPQTG